MSILNVICLFIFLLVYVWFVSGFLAIMNKTATNINVQNKYTSLLHGPYVLSSLESISSSVIRSLRIFDS